MPAIHFEQLNWWAIVTTTFTTMALGGVWYAALFGKLWARLNGYSDEKLKHMQKARPPAVFFGGMIGAYFVLSVVVSVLSSWLGVNSAAHGAALGLALWLGVAAPIGITTFIAYDRPLGVYAIDLSYQCAFLVTTGAVIGGWH